MLNITGIIGKFIKNSSQREIDKLKIIVQKINYWESKIKDLQDKNFPAKTQELKMYYEDEFARALAEDGSASSTLVTPLTYYPAVS